MKHFLRTYPLTDEERIKVKKLLKEGVKLYDALSVISLERVQ